jgi:hypothetical protein
MNIIPISEKLSRMMGKVSIVIPGQIHDFKKKGIDNLRCFSCCIFREVGFGICLIILIRIRYIHPDCKVPAPSGSPAIIEKKNDMAGFLPLDLKSDGDPLNRNVRITPGNITGDQSSCLRTTMK